MTRREKLERHSGMGHTQQPIRFRKSNKRDLEITLSLDFWGYNGARENMLQIMDEEGRKLLVHF